VHRVVGDDHEPHRQPRGGAVRVAGVGVEVAPVPGVAGHVLGHGDVVRQPVAVDYRVGAEDHGERRGRERDQGEGERVDEGVQDRDRPRADLVLRHVAGLEDVVSNQVREDLFHIMVRF